MMLLDPARLARLARLPRRVVRAGLIRAKGPARPAFRRLMLARGVNDTSAAVRRSCLVIAPHPDDETIGCGSSIAAKRAAGTPVDVVVVTDGRHSHVSAHVSPARLAEMREYESREACAVLGVAEDAVRFLGYEEGTLWDRLDTLAADLAALIDEVRPDEVLVTSEHDWHVDHQATNAAVLRAVALATHAPRIGAFPVWFWADGPWRTMPTAGLGEQLSTVIRHPLQVRALPRPWLVSTKGFVDTKREAFSKYESQTTNITGESTWAVFPDGWIDAFCGPYEVFFPAEPSPTAGAERERNKN